MKEKPTKAKKKGRTIRAFKRDISLWLFCVPGVILTFIFSYIPMYGVQIAFRRFNATAGITKSPWVGMYYFERFFNSPYFASTIKNTCDPELVRTGRIIPDSDHPGTDAELLPP